MDVHDYRALAWKLFGIGRVEVPRDGLAIKSLPFDELGRGEHGSVKASGLAEGPALNLAGGDMERINV